MRSLQADFGEVVGNEEDKSLGVARLEDQGNVDVASK